MQQHTAILIIYTGWPNNLAPQRQRTNETPFACARRTPLDWGQHCWLPSAHGTPINHTLENQSCSWGRASGTTHTWWHCWYPTHHITQHTQPSRSIHQTSHNTHPHYHHLSLSTITHHTYVTHHITQSLISHHPSYITHHLTHLPSHITHHSSLATHHHPSQCVTLLYEWEFNNTITGCRHWVWTQRQPRQWHSVGGAASQLLPKRWWCLLVWRGGVWSLLHNRPKCHTKPSGALGPHSEGKRKMMMLKKEFMFHFGHNLFDVQCTQIHIVSVILQCFLQCGDVFLSVHSNALPFVLCNIPWMFHHVYVVKQMVFWVQFFEHISQLPSAKTYCHCGAATKRELWHDGFHNESSTEFGKVWVIIEVVVLAIFEEAQWTQAGDVKWRVKCFCTTIVFDHVVDEPSWWLFSSCNQWIGVNVYFVTLASSQRSTFEVMLNA